MSNTLKKWVMVTNLVFIMLILSGDAIYMIRGGLAVKGVTSGLFLLMGLTNLIFLKLSKKENVKFSIFLVLGLLFAMAGDIALNLNFILGAVLFALGHVMFFVSFLFLEKFRWEDILYGVTIFLPSLFIILFVPIFNFKGIVMEMVCIAYALVISFMVGKSLSNFIKTKSIQNLIILLGSILFFLSDFMLLLNVFGGVGKFADIICLITYYPAEILLAMSIILGKNKEVEKIE